MKESIKEKYEFVLEVASFSNYTWLKAGILFLLNKLKSSLSKLQTIIQTEQDRRHAL